MTFLLESPSQDLGERAGSRASHKHSQSVQPGGSLRGMESKSQTKDGVRMAMRTLGLYLLWGKEVVYMQNCQ